MPSDASVVGSLVSLNDNTRIAVVDQQPSVPYSENGLVRIVDEMRKAGSPEDVTKVLDIILHESRSKVFIIKLCTILVVIVVQCLHPTLNAADRLTAHSNEEQTKQTMAVEATKQAEFDACAKQATAEETTKQAAEATKQAEFEARTKLAAEVTKQAEISARTKREEDERRTDETARLKTIILLQKMITCNTKQK
jgi:hypothetical protein